MLAQIFPDITCKGIESVSETSSATDVSGQVLEICQKKASAVNNATDFDLVIAQSVFRRVQSLLGVGRVNSPVLGN